MDLFSVLGIVLVTLLIILICKLVFHYIHAIFYSLLIVLMLILVFDISWSEVTGWFLRALLWVL